MLNAREITIKLPHTELAGLEFGDKDGEPVLALHGWLDNAMSFARLAPKLKGMHIIALDLRGHGLSQHKPSGSIYQTWEAVFDVLAVVQHLGWQQFSLLGHSLGAIIAVMVAATTPAQVKQLMLIDGLVPYPKQPTEFPKRMQQALAGLSKSIKSQQVGKVYVYDSLEDMIKKRQQGLVSVSYEAASYLMERGAKAVADGYVWCSDRQLMILSPMPFTEEAAWSYAEVVTCPMRLIVASRGLLIGNKGFMQRLSNLVHCEVSILEGEHHLHLEAEQSAQSVADCFNSFFKR